MKTVQNGSEIRRVADEEAAALVKNGWSYCPKSVWKQKVRDIGDKSGK